MTERLRRAGSLSWALCGVAALSAVAVVLLWQVRVVFPPLVLAGAIVFILNPPVTAMQRHGIPRAAGAAISYLAVAAAIGLAILVVAPVANSQGRELAREWPEIREKAEAWLDERAADSRGTFLEFSVDEVEEAFGSDVPFTEQLDRIREIGLEVLHVLLVLVLAPIIAFYLLVDLPHLRHTAESLVPAAARADVLVVGHRLNRAIGGFFRGQLFIAAIVGILCSIGLAAIGLRFWFLIGIIAGISNLVPLIGPWIGGLPGVVIALTTGSLLKAAGVVAVMATVQQIDNHFITPQVMQRAVRLHPAAVMLALLAGGTIGGFFGLLLAVPGAAVLKIVLGYLWRTHVLGEPLEELAVAAEADDASGTGVLQRLDGEPGGAPQAVRPA